MHLVIERVKGNVRQAACCFCMLFADRRQRAAKLSFHWMAKCVRHRPHGNTPEKVQRKEASIELRGLFQRMELHQHFVFGCPLKPTFLMAVKRWRTSLDNIDNTYLLT